MLLLSVHKRISSMFLLVFSLCVSWCFMFYSFRLSAPPYILKHTLRGLRQEGTERGSWEGAWIIAQDSEGHSYHAFFDRGQRFVGDKYISWSTLSQQEALLLSNVYEPWYTMCEKDLLQTSGF